MRPVWFFVLASCATPIERPQEATPEEFGLDAKPLNETCVLPERSNAPAVLLSGTGCFLIGGLPAQGLIPYEIQSPLWSDGATKKRWFALPADSKIGVADDTGVFLMPVGAVAVKEFSFGTTRVETRLLMRFSETQYKGYTYAWRADQSDADLVQDSVTGSRQTVDTDLGAMSWYYPTRSECLTCHVKVAGVWLGLRLEQMATTASYADRTANQLATLQHIDVLPSTLPAFTQMPLPADAGANLALRARAYLAANCAQCHQPGGAMGEIDLRFSTPLGAAGVCNAASERTPNAFRLVPGDPEHSTLVQRMLLQNNPLRMPPLSTDLVDTVGAQLVTDFVKSLSSCHPD